MRSSSISACVLLKFKNFARLSLVRGLAVDKHNSSKFFFLFLYKLFKSVSTRFFYLKRLAFNAFARRAKLSFVFALLRHVVSKVALNFSNWVAFTALSRSFVVTSLVGVNFFLSKNFGVRYFLTDMDVSYYNSESPAEAAKITLAFRVTEMPFTSMQSYLPLFVLGAELVACGFVAWEASLLVLPLYDAWRPYLRCFGVTSGFLL